MIIVMVCDLVVQFQPSQVALVLLYAGPDQVLPLLSIIGAIIGFLLLWWQRLVQLIRRGWQAAFKRSRREPKLPT